MLGKPVNGTGTFVETFSYGNVSDLIGFSSNLEFDPPCKLLGFAKKLIQNVKFRHSDC